MAKRGAREEIWDLEEGLLLFRWGDRHRAVKRRYPAAYKSPREEIRAFGTLGHIDRFVTLGGIDLRALYEEPSDQQAFWLEPMDHTVSGHAVLAAVLAQLGLTEADRTVDEYGEACWKGARWVMHAYPDDDENPPVWLMTTV